MLIICRFQDLIKFNFDSRWRSKLFGKEGVVFVDNSVNLGINTLKGDSAGFDSVDLDGVVLNDGPTDLKSANFLTISPILKIQMSN